MFCGFGFVGFWANFLVDCVVRVSGLTLGGGFRGCIGGFVLVFLGGFGLY